MLVFRRIAFTLVLLLFVSPRLSACSLSSATLWKTDYTCTLKGKLHVTYSSNLANGGIEIAPSDSSGTVVDWNRVV